MRVVPALAALAVLCLCAASTSPAGQVSAAARCEPPAVSSAYAARIGRMLSSGRDVWGDRLLAAREGPTLAAAGRLLPPLLYAAGRGGRPLTKSGVYYVPFTMPTSPADARGFGLHVADGSEIIVRRAHGPSVTVNVGRGGRERYGSCLARLRTPRLADGYLPMLETQYTDGAGVHYQQESFVGRPPSFGSVSRAWSLVSFVRLRADATEARAASTMRLRSSRRAWTRVVVQPGETAELDAAFVHDGRQLLRIDPAAYDKARAQVVKFWDDALATMPTIDVPEPRVADALRALEVQALAMTWRYSVGNHYEELSYAEALDVAQVLAEYGQDDVARQILQFTVRKLLRHYTNWRAGERLVAGAQHYRLTRDDAYVAASTPRLRAAVDRIARQLATNPRHILARERFSSDIAKYVYSLQGQTVVWQGLRDMARVWAETGRPGLARYARRTAARLEHGLRRAVRVSSRRLPDGSLFVPATLLDHPGPPFRRLTATRAGSYWNLVAPYALASGFFRPHGTESRLLLRYLLRHGSRMLGLVRAGAYRLSGGDPRFSGTDQAYGANVCRFLADNDQPNHLVLSLYGTLAAAMTPGTYVAGEAASVTPRHGRLYRTMYLPPNNATVATFLETLRLLLVHEVRGAGGRPRGLELAFATPRAWLAPGKSIEVRDMPTSFGPLSYLVEREGEVVRIDVEPPASPAPAFLRLRLRLPGDRRIARVELDGRRIPFAAGGTIDLPTSSGDLELVATLVPQKGRLIPPATARPLSTWLKGGSDGPAAAWYTQRVRAR